MASNRGRSSSISDSPIELVQIDGLALLKIIKHCEEEGAGNMDVAQGVLLGLVQDTRLEVTNCFPFPRNPDDFFNEETYQLKMMRNLRKVNVDHLHVGWYQSTQQGSFLSNMLLESQYSYQTSIDESVVLIYNPTKTSRGFLSLKAYRLTGKALQLYRDGDFTCDAVKKLKIGFETLFQEIKVVVRNSHLANSLLAELEAHLPGEQAEQFLDLGTTSVLERHLRMMMTSVDELCTESNKFNGYQKQVAKACQNRLQAIQRLPIENESRKQRGESPLTEDDVVKQYKMPQPPPRIEPMIVCAHVNNSCRSLSEFSSQALGKLFIAEALHEGKNKATQS